VHGVARSVQAAGAWPGWVQISSQRPLACRQRKVRMPAAPGTGHLMPDSLQRCPTIALAEVRAALPAAAEPGEAGPDNSAEEVTGWLDLHSRQDYWAAEGHFRARQEACAERELGAFAQWCEAKAAYLEGRRGDAAAASRALVTLEQAIGRGGASSWFNRQRGSLLRHRQQAATAPVVNPGDFPAAVIHAFDELLERLGTWPRLERWRARLSAGLAATSHDQYAEAIETLGILLGYSATRPRYGAATDCRWRGVFGNHREAVTWEAKIEHVDRTSVCGSDIGQAHNQLTRAETELGSRGLPRARHHRHSHVRPSPSITEAV
jgi:hypothetical protein